MEKVIVVSGINIRSGGTLSIMQECLKYLSHNLSSDYKIVAIVHSRQLFNIKAIEYIEFPNSIDSWLIRLYYEYIHFRKLSLKIRPYLWLSLHDITPNVKSEIRAVYCHNSTPFYRVTFHDFFLAYDFALFCLFYKYLYGINIKKNNWVIVQQEWLRNEFRKLFNIENVIVAYPHIQGGTNVTNRKECDAKTYRFFYPAFPRIFKNFEVIFESVILLNKRGVENFEVILTIDPLQNKYTKYLLRKYGRIKNIIFIGLQSRDIVYRYYEHVDCLIFSSKLETWGMPITEFKVFKKPIVIADLPYAHETIGGYNKVKFFDQGNSNILACYMEELIKGTIEYDKNKCVVPSQPFTQNWGKLFQLLLSRDTEVIQKTVEV